MQCTDVKMRLSEYIDGVLDPETRSRLEEHLAACKGCAGELASLRTLIHELGSLEPVEAPGDFLEQLHERLEAPSRLAGILRALFVPFRIKIPLEFAGAAVAALLVFFVLQVQEPITEIPPVTQALKQERTAPKILPSPQAPAPAAQGAPILLMEGKETEEKRGNGSAPIELAFILRNHLERPDTASYGGVKSAPLSSPRAPSKAPLALDEEQAAAPSSASREPSFKARDLPAKKGLVAPLARLTELVRHRGGEIKEVEYAKESREPRSILLVIPSENLPTLMKDLETVGTLQTSPRFPMEDPQKKILVRLRFAPERP